MTQTFDVEAAKAKVAQLSEQEKLEKLAQLLAREEHAKAMAARPEAKLANKLSRDKAKATAKALKELATPEMLELARQIAAKQASGNGSPTA
jgi:septation ring formation regulator EzrA